MKLLYFLIIIGGFGYILFQLFLSSGGRTKFKSDLPKTDVVKVKRKWGILICFSILSLVTLALLIVALISLLL